MTLTPGDDLDETSRQRTRDQFALLQRPESTALIIDSDDPADFTFACHTTRVLVNDDRAVAALQQYFQGRIDSGDGVFAGIGETDAEQPNERLFLRFTPPSRAGAVPGDRSLLLTLDELDQDPETRDLARPDHLVHICGGRPSRCPATEPTETGRVAPWPAQEDVTSVAGDGSGVTVVVLDTGWYNPMLAQEPPEAWPWPWMTQTDGDPEPGGILEPDPRDANQQVLRQYAGHGTFIAGVIQAVAPESNVVVLPLPVDPDLLPGGAFESEFVGQLDLALNDHDPDLINISAGCPTRLDRPALAFERWWADVKSDWEERLVVVAAAGNNASPWGFWPASFDWALGVGSVDRDGGVSNFSNWGDSVDVYALGRNIVNAFPNGDYLCRETPDKGDVRTFGNWRARWSGTSFSAPLVTGMIARVLSLRADNDPRKARNDVIGGPPLPSLRSSVTQTGNTMMPALRAAQVPRVADELLDLGV
jgi:hypothetical protein